MIVEAAPVVSCQVDRRAVPVRHLNDRDDQTGYLGLASTDQRRRMLAIWPALNYPEDRGHGVGLRGLVELGEVLDVPFRAIRFHRGEPGQRIPKAWRLGMLGLRRTGLLIGSAIGLRAPLDAVSPAYLVLVLQEG